MKYLEERKALIAAALESRSKGMIKGTSGNISLRCAEGLIAITPSSVDYSLLRPEDICILDLEGNHVDCSRAPSSEWRMHLAVYAARGDVGAVVHTHSMFSTVMASVRDILPAVTVPGTEFYPVRSAPFAMPGTVELADVVVKTLGGGDAVLLEHHGLLCTGKTLEKAMKCAEYVEENAEVAYRLLAVDCHRQMSGKAVKEIGENLKKGLTQ